jgi:uncharacterized protein (DUF305 family)
VLAARKTKLKEMPMQQRDGRSTVRAVTNTSKPLVLARSALALVLAATLAVACGDDDDDAGHNMGGAPGETGGGSAPAGSPGAPQAGAPSTGGAGGEAASKALAIEGDRRIPFTPTSDLAFVDFFLPHHRMAIDMANEVIERGRDADVKAMAQEIVRAQTAEVEQLTEIRTTLEGEVPGMPADPHAEAEMDAMKNASGAELDRLFVLEMIPHHASALPVAHRALDYLEAPDLVQLAQHIAEAQATEIGAMQHMLQQLGVSGAGQDHAAATSRRPDFGLVGDRRVPLTPKDDVEMIDFFVPHHEMAIMMAEHEIAHGADPDVVAMAQRMKDSQTAEVQLMKDKRAELAGSAEPSTPPEDPHMMAEMRAMEAMEGAELDHLFLEEMITHHASALPTSHRAKPHVEDADLQQLADAMFEAQAAEIGEMRLMLEP